MKGKREQKERRWSLPNSGDYTIFHALHETMMKKREMDSKQDRFPGNMQMLANLAALFLAASGLIILAWGIHTF